MSFLSAGVYPAMGMRQTANVLAGRVKVAVFPLAGRMDSTGIMRSGFSKVLSQSRSGVPSERRGGGEGDDTSVGQRAAFSQFLKIQGDLLRAVRGVGNLYNVAAFVGQPCSLVFVRSGGKSDVVWIAVKGSVVKQGDCSETFPAHKVLRKFERAVFDHFGVEAAVSGIVDVFEEESVHCRLYFGSRMVGADDEFFGLYWQTGYDGGEH